MKLQKILNRLQELHPKEIDLSLDRVKELCKKLGNPQDKIKSISVVGTNGKNSSINAMFSILKKDLENNLWVCPDCNKHHRINPKQRFDILFGKDNYEIFKTPIPNDDPLDWTDSKSYKDRLKNARKKLGLIVE